jgi:hypothetical protein
MKQMLAITPLLLVNSPVNRDFKVQPQFKVMLTLLTLELKSFKYRPNPRF